MTCAGTAARAALHPTAACCRVTGARPAARRNLRWCREITHVLSVFRHLSTLNVFINRSRITKLRFAGFAARRDGERNNKKYSMKLVDWTAGSPGFCECPVFEGGVRMLRLSFRSHVSIQITLPEPEFS